LGKRCLYCGRYFVPDRRVGDRQKACGSEVCKRKRKQAAQRRWSENNPGYFKGRYDYVKGMAAEAEDLHLPARQNDTRRDNCIEVNEDVYFADTGG